MSSRFLQFGLIAALAMGAAALAQTVDSLDLGAIRRKAETQQAEAQATINGASGRGDPYEADAEALRATAMERLAAFSPADLPKGPDGAIDFDELVAGAVGNAAGVQGEAPLFMVFASLSMPPASLRQLIADTTKAGGVVVFRGFPGNSAKQFSAALAKIVDRDGGEPHIGIDPRLFRAFHVEAAPTFIVASSDFDLCAGFDCVSDVPPYDRLVGNVTVEFALESVVDAHGPGSAVAATALANLKKPG